MATTHVKKAVASAQVDPTDKAIVQSILKDAGMSESTFISMVYRQVARTYVLPLTLDFSKNRNYNEETLAAFKESDEMIGKNTFTRRKWSNKKEFRAELLEDK